VAKEVVKRARAFGMNSVGFGNQWDQSFASQFELVRRESPRHVLREADVVSLHTHLTPQTRGMINRDSLALMKHGALLINTARGGLVVEEDVVNACRSGQLGGYASDVLEVEPMRAPHAFQNVENVIVTPHVGSRTRESVERQGVRAATNLVNCLSGVGDFIQANRF
jgi:D-3-phosphoglycerate dehydrogenase